MTEARAVAPNTRVIAGTAGAVSVFLLAFLGQWEGEGKLTPYRDIADPNLWTVCRGITNRSAPGWVVPERKYTERECAAKEADLLSRIYSPRLARMLKVDVTQRQWEMLLSFGWNAGLANLASSTLLRKLNAGDCKGAAAEFDRWIYAGGIIWPGLANRRNAEQGEFLKGCGVLDATKNKKIGSVNYPSFVLAGAY